MSDEAHVIRNINWREVFPFTHIFRSFRVAIHPSKLLLALAALITLYVGGRVLDGVWLSRHRAVPNEVDRYETYMLTGERGTFTDARNLERRTIENEYASMLLMMKLADTPDKAQADARDGRRLGDVKKKIVEARTEQLKEIDKEYRASVDAAQKLPNAKEKDDALDDARRNRDSRIRDTYTIASDAYARAKKIQNEGLFAQFFEYQTTQINGVARGVWGGNPRGVINSLTNLLTVGPMWLMSQHTIFFILLALLFLLVWAVFGGAISRIAAVHVARDEKISIRQALRFSVGKVVSFVFAPIIPLLIVLVVGLLVTAVSLIGNIPGIGPIIVGALFILALVAGFVMTLVLLGLAGGFNLMYPTIAVEGSDSFDAISRSFSYLYARPWRLAFYTAVAIVYGALTYLFVRLFIYLMLLMTHKFVGLGIFYDADNTRSLWHVMWPSPSTTGRFLYDIDTMTLGGGQMIGAYLVWFWVFLVIAMLGAFAISFYFSASTIIYYLMRNEVDATEIEDVYVEQTEDEFAEPTTTPTTAAVATAIENAPPITGTAPAATPAPMSETPQPPPAPPPTNPAPGENGANPT